jgi:hypothetical protein
VREYYGAAVADNFFRPELETSDAPLFIIFNTMKRHGSQQAGWVTDLCLLNVPL